MALPQTLPKLPPWERLSPLVTTVLGLNPGPFTLTGTNTYLCGSGKARILVDTGEGRPEYLDNLAAAMAAVGCERIERILLTHWHRDHTGGIAGVLSRFGPDIPLHKVPHPEDSKAHTFQPIADGQEFVTSDGSARLRAFYTPGHTEDHVCFALAPDAEHRGVFGGDCVLGIGSAVFEDLHAYMGSLDRILARRPARIYSSHGPLIEDGTERLEAYIAHRGAREQQIVDALRQGDDTAAGLVARIYIDTPKHLHPAAQGNVEHHLDKLAKDGVVEERENGRWGMRARGAAL